MKTTHVLAGIVVDDIEAGTTWWAELFGRPADTVPMASCHEWRLGADVTLQVHQNPGAKAGQSSIALVVDDLEAALAEAPSGRFGEIEVVSVARIARARDPEGNQVTLVEPRSSAHFRNR